MTPPNGHTQILKHLHWFLVWVIGWWSFALTMPGDTFGNNPRFYHLFTVVMTENQWSVFLGAASFIGVVGINWRVLRLPTIHLLCLVHALVAAFLFIPNPIGFSSGVPVGLTVASYYLLWRQRPSKVSTND